MSLLLAGCGSDEENSESESSISEQMGYTITGLEPGAGQTELNDEAIEVYDSLDGWTQELSSTGAMLSSLSEAIEKEEPIIITGWSPHYKFARWDLKFLEDPEDVYGVEETAKAIASGDADVSLSPWMPTTHGELYAEYEGDFEEVGTIFSGAQIGLAVPAYMEIDSIADLEPKE